MPTYIAHSSQVFLSKYFNPPKLLNAKLDDETIFNKLTSPSN